MKAVSLVAVLVAALAAGCLAELQPLEPGTSPADEGPAEAASAVEIPPVRVEHDYADDAEEVTWETAEDGSFTIYLWSEPTAPDRPCVVQGARIVLTSPSQTFTVENDDNGFSVSWQASCGNFLLGKVIHAPAGEWRVRFEGTGIGRGVVEVTPT